MSSDDPGREASVEALAELLDRIAADARRAPAPELPAAVAAELREPGTWSEPPAGTRAAVLAAVAEEAAGASGTTRHGRAPAPAGEDAGDAGPAVVSPLPRERRVERPARPLRLVAVAAAVAAVFSIGVLAADRALQPRGETYALAGTGLAPGVTAEVEVLATGSGFRVSLAAGGLPAAAPGSYYSAWLSGPAGVVPLGSFHGRGRGPEVALWSGVDPAAYPDFAVTLQAEGDPPAPSGRVVLRGRLTR